MTQNLMQSETNSVQAGIDVPAKFLTAKGELNGPALLQSYRELERKMGGMVRVPSDDDPEEYRLDFYKKIGVPDSADAYKLEIRNELLAADPEVNERLRMLGFTNKQVQAVYDLAAEKVLPVIQELAQEYEASRQRVSLENQFGGKERFQEVARQISAWAKQNIAPEIFDALSTTFEGVMTLYKMMESGEPALMEKGAPVNEVLDEEGLKKLMMSPKYWRDQDPAILKKVSDGFNRLYPSTNR